MFNFTSIIIVIVYTVSGNWATNSWRYLRQSVIDLYTSFITKKKKLRYCEEHSASVMLVGVLYDIASSAELLQRDRAAGWVSYGQKLKARTDRLYFSDIIRRKIKAITPFKANQGPVYATFY